MGFLSWLFGNDPKPGSQKSTLMTRPAWVIAADVSSKPIQLCTQLTEVDLFRGSPPQQHVDSTAALANSTFIEGGIRPALGAEYAVPWPMPIAASVQALTFWGTGNGHTEEFVLPADAALRIVVKGGPIVLRVRRMNGRYVADHAQLGGQAVCLGLMAIPTSGNYALLIETAADVEWGVTVLYQGPPAGVT